MPPVTTIFLYYLGLRCHIIRTGLLFLQILAESRCLNSDCPSPEFDACLHRVHGEHFNNDRPYGSKGHPGYDISTTTLLCVGCSLLLSQPLSATEEVVLCENAYDTFTCDAETNETMHVIYANYGRLSLDICVPTGGINYPYNVTDCRAANSTEILQAKCDGTVSCQFHAAASKFGGDPCLYVHKYLEVTYACKQPDLSSVNTTAESTVFSTQSSNAVSSLPSTESQWSTGVSLNMAAEDTPYNFYSREIRIAIYSVVGGVLVVGLTTVTGCLLCQRNITRFCCGSGTTTVRPVDKEEEE